ncbi:OprD family porin [Pseudomonas sp. NW5]|uniref:OprD family porin n=1 Tax=Pseudomonas sp. NW5 TaxID=2934934 RepID=UPI00201FC1A3|nr:OprD family porin [Pseudomonas sp. NW5]MCL7462367.1 OprD family porin [Pseudomonas sp. NW5]
MNKISQRSKLGLSILAAAMAIPAVSQAALVEDSKASLELRNMYQNRDVRNAHGANTDTHKEWAQGFKLRFESGFTEGTVGVGIDALGMAGIKLDHSNGQNRNGSGVLNINHKGDGRGDAESSFGELGLTAKARISKTVLKLGTLEPMLPVVMANDARLLTSTYAGGMITSQEIDGLTLNAGRLERHNDRDDSSNQKIRLRTPSYAGGVEADRLDFAGGSYVISPELTASYYYGNMEDVYKQHFVGAVHNANLGDGLTLRTDLRYFKSKDEGRALGGKIDNDFFNGMVTLGMNAHKFGLGYSTVSGDGNFPYAAIDAYTVNSVSLTDFTLADMDAWQLRYDLDFTSLGVPGLSFMTRYIYGDDAQVGTANTGKQIERDSLISYAFQSGPIKGARVTWLNATLRNGGGLTTQDLNENRLIVSYTLPLL